MFMYMIMFIMITFGIYCSIYILYSVMLFIINYLIKDQGGEYHSTDTKFCVLIPAHNEELYISRLLESLKQQKYPMTLFNIFVIADNCKDRTAEIAGEYKVNIINREDIVKIGKGYALKYALERVEIGRFDAVFIIDADSVVQDELLLELNSMISRGENAIQCYNGVENPDTSWFTRLLDVSRTIGNEIIHPAKQKVGLSSYLMGNGMCFSTRLLQEVGWDAFTVGEDWEYYARLIKDGRTVSFAKRARVYHQESFSLRQATSQRLRWSSGRFAIAWKDGFKIFSSGFRERNIRKMDAAMPLLLPNPSLAMNITIILLLLSIIFSRTYNNIYYLEWFATLAGIQLFMFIIGAMYTKDKINNILSLFLAPVFLIWKFGIDVISVFGISSKTWVRTKRMAK